MLDAGTRRELFALLGRPDDDRPVLAEHCRRGRRRTRDGAACLDDFLQHDPKIRTTPLPQTLYRVSTSGGTPLSLGVVNGAQPFATDDSAVYYSATGVSRINFDGTGSTLLSTQFGRNLGIDDTNVYFATDPCYDMSWQDNCEDRPVVYKVAKAGGATTQLAVASQQIVVGLVVAAGRVFKQEMTVDGEEQAIRSVATSGGEATTVSSGGWIQSFAADSSFVYWLENDESGGSATYNYKLRRVDITGANPTVLVADVGLGEAIAVDDTAIVWSRENPPNTGNQGSVWLLAK